MNQPGVPLAWDGERQLRLPRAGRSAQEIQNAHHPRAPLHNTGATQLDSAFQVQQSALPQYFHQAPSVDLLGNGSQAQAFCAQDHAWHHLLRSILAHPDIATYRDGVCNYLRIPLGLWIELYKPQVPDHVHQMLTDCLALNYGRLPDDLGILIKELRDHIDFPHLQTHLINVIMSTVPQRDPPHTPSGSSGQDVRPMGSRRLGRDFDESEETSPTLVIPSPRTAQSGRTAVTTPLFTGNARSTPQSPFQRKKRRAPRGERYKCPYTNCKHEPFRNAGNFINHMRNCHAESPYRDQDPSDFLIPDLSPQPSVQGDVMSSAATNADDSPLSYCRSSQEFGNGEIAGGGDGSAQWLESIRDGVLIHASHTGFQACIMRGGLNHADSREGQVTSGLANSSLLESFRFSPNSHQLQLDIALDGGPDDTTRLSPAEVGPVGFYDFQIMERHRYSDGRSR
ncbi:hypothetical protein PV04_06868 [Phialophora macrospora]|uniref:Uncharacterized protein n=1 Tax=Phialophora macrospora TaxID=1851006 RepID=A0A0D2CR59_9EURO|nr:hypothetical protein PV04_06868 [Phialophora macrospora]